MAAGPLDPRFPEHGEEHESPVLTIDQEGDTPVVEQPPAAPPVVPVESDGFIPDDEFMLEDDADLPPPETPSIFTAGAPTGGASGKSEALVNNMAMDGQLPEGMVEGASAASYDSNPDKKEEERRKREAATFAAFIQMQIGEIKEDIAELEGLLENYTDEKAFWEDKADGLKEAMALNQETIETLQQQVEMGRSRFDFLKEEFSGDPESLLEALNNPLTDDQGRLVYQDQETGMLYHLEQNPDTGKFSRVTYDVEEMARLMHEAWDPDDPKLFANETFKGRDPENVQVGEWIKVQARIPGGDLNPQGADELDPAAVDASQLGNYALSIRMVAKEGSLADPENAKQALAVCLEMQGKMQCMLSEAESNLDIINRNIQKTEDLLAEKRQELREFEEGGHELEGRTAKDIEAEIAELHADLAQLREDQVTEMLAQPPTTSSEPWFADKDSWINSKRMSQAPGDNDPGTSSSTEPPAMTMAPDEDFTTTAAETTTATTETTTTAVESGEMSDADTDTGTLDHPAMAPDEGQMAIDASKNEIADIVSNSGVISPDELGPIAASYGIPLAYLDKLIDTLTDMDPNLEIRDLVAVPSIFGGDGVWSPVNDPTGNAPVLDDDWSTISHANDLDREEALQLSGAFGSAVAANDENTAKPAQDNELVHENTGPNVQGLNV